MQRRTFFCGKERITEGMKFFLLGSLTFGGQLANAERISRVAVRTSTHRAMIHHRAQSVRTAQTDTRIATLLLHASQVWRALRIDRALGSTIRRNTDVILDARTRRTITAHMTLGVWSAWRRLARIRRHRWLLCEGRNDCNL